MVATQAVGGDPLLKYTKTFKLQHSMDNVTWYNVTEDGTKNGIEQVNLSIPGAPGKSSLYQKFKNGTSLESKSWKRHER